MSQTLAFDLGGSSLRLAVVAPDGSFVGMVRKPLNVQRAGDDRFEADPASWWIAFCDACADLVDGGCDLSAVTAIAGCGFTRTQVFLDQAGRSLRPALTFQDARAAVMLQQMSNSDDPDLRAVAAALGPYDPLARLLWLKREEPEPWSRLAKIVEPKDFLNLMLTGIAASDTISQTPMTRSLSVLGPDLVARLGVDVRCVPDRMSPFARLGVVRSDMPPVLTPLKGVPVFCGSMDTWTGVLGSGGLKPGIGYAISGTSDVSGVITEVPCEADGLLSVEWGEGLWQLGGPSQGAATRLDWITDRVRPGTDPSDALRTALSSSRPAPVFLPFIDGERTPWWDPDLRGAFLGLETDHDADDFIRSVCEGMNYLSREILSRAEAASGAQVDHVCFSGGLANSRDLCQLKADVLNRQVRVPTTLETGLAGAARIVIGNSAGMKEVSATIYTPNPRRRAYHDTRFDIFLSAAAALRPISHRLARPSERTS
jgi:xylulokinase